MGSDEVESSGKEMKMSRKKDMEVLSVQITYRCKCGAEASCFSAPGAFCAIVQECDICGEHGHVLTSVRCAECGKEYKIIINEW